MHGKILFVCVENAGRSKMAEAFGMKYGLDCRSAGTMPSDRVNPDVVKVMDEIGIALNSGKPSMLTEEMVMNADRVITMGCSVEEACPAILYRNIARKLTEWDLPDPKNKSMDEIREIRNRIEKLVRELSENEH